MNRITKRTNQSLVKPEDLSRWILIGKAKLRSQIAAIKAISRLEEGLAAREAALADTQDLAEELLYAEARLGEMLAKSSSKGTFKKGGERSLPGGIDKRQSHYAQTLSKNEDTIAKVVAEAREKGEVPVRQHVLHAIKTGHSLLNLWTGNPESYTPSKLVEKIRRVLGAIDLDPASCDLAQEIVRARTYYTIAENGLDKSWHGRVFLNPPYRMPEIRDFTNKLIEELPHITAAALLTNDQTDTRWWQKCARNAKLILCFNRRVRFWRADTDKTSPTNGQTLMYFGEDETTFIREFRDLGILFTQVSGNCERLGPEREDRR